MTRTAKVATVAAGAAAGAVLLYTLISIPPQQQAVLAWKYPPTINPSNYWWNLEASSDLVNWETIQTNVSGEVFVTNSKAIPFKAFRLAGRLSP